jgi:hypothetical protein
MSGASRQPFCPCGKPVAPPRTRYCSDECVRQAQNARRRERDARRPPRDRSAYARAYYAAVKADPERWAALQEYRRRYAAEHRERARQHQREWKERLRADPERYQAVLAVERDRKRIWAKANHERKLEQQRSSYWRLRADPERWARWLETHRLAYRLQREREGRPLPALSAQEYRERYGRGYGRSTLLPAAPLRPLIERALESESEVELGRRAAVADRRLREILTGKRNISLVTADRLCVALGFTLSVVYQEAA